MPGPRELSRAAVTARILDAARQEIATRGAGGLSMRAIAREVGMVSSAVYRYFPTREALLTAMIVESYGRLAEALGTADADARAEATSSSPQQVWQRLCHAFRDWSLAHPHEFQLVYGTPIPGYVAPPETVPAAAAVAMPFLRVADSPVDGFGVLDTQLHRVADEVGVAPSRFGAVLAELGTLVGLVNLELAGHFVGTADPARTLFDAVVSRQTRTLGLAGPPA